MTTQPGRQPTAAEGRQMPVEVRPAVAADIPSISAIYAHHVRTGTGSFEEEAPNEDEMHIRFALVTARRLPYLVAVSSGGVRGFAYAAPFRPRSAYRFTVEDSVYVEPAMVGLGLGRLLLAGLIDRCRCQGLRQMVAVIGDSDNQRSIALHAALGFRAAGTLQQVGCKFGRPLDVVFMQRAIAGDPSPD